MANRPSAGLPRLSRRNKILLIIGVLILVLLIAGSRLLSTYVSWLWFGSVGFRSVFSTIVVTKVVLFFAAGAFIGGMVALSLVIAYRARPVFVPVSGVDDPVARYRAVVTRRLKLFGIGIPVIIGLIAGAAAMGDWQVVQLFMHGTSFHIQDPIFHKDIGFYAFTLPMILWLKNWVFIGIALAFFAALFAHYLFGGIRFAGRGGQLSAPARAHLAIVIGCFVLMKAFAYYFDRYSLLGSNRNDKFTGASYTDLNALMPAKLILLCIAVFCAIAFFVGAFLRNLQLPAIAAVLMILSAIIVGAAWPLIMEQFSVKANANQKEAKPIEHNIQATRQAYGITPNKIKTVPYDPATANPTNAEVKSEQGTLSNIRVLDPNILSQTFTQLEQGRNFYGFPKRLNIDRYTVDGKTQDYIVAAREIDSSGLAANQRDWINKHLVYTHGDGFVAAPANQVNQSAQGGGEQGGYPNFQVSDLNNPGKGGLHVTQPRIYYGELNKDYAVVGAEPGQQPREYDTDTRNYTYKGNGGVSVSNWFNRLVFAGYFGERNFLFSSAIGANSKVLIHRDPRDRVQQVAPWLTADGDPYPAVVNGRIKWIVDCYTTLDNYPYAEKTSLGKATNDSLNNVAKQSNDKQITYIRNSVKATVDAYSGKVTLWSVDDSDPVLKAWEGVFPGSVTPSKDIPAALRAHFRYPEDLFKVQRQLLTQYHVSNPQDFYSTQTFWSVPPDPTVKADATTNGGGNGANGAPTSSAGSNDPSQPPYYVLAQIPGETKPTFQLTSALTALQRQNLAAWMSVSCDPKTYGQFTVLTLPTKTQTAGPVQVQNQFDSTDKVTQNRTLFNNPAVDAKFGNLLTLPVAGKLLYVEPIYIQRHGDNSYPQLARVLVEFNGEVGFEKTLDGALADVLGGGSTTPPGQSNKPPPTTTTPPPANSKAGNNPALETAVSDIQKALDDLQAAQKAGDYTAMGKAYQELGDATSRFEQAKSGTGGSSSSTQKPGS
ncbi:MAG: UPF0182 family protein [Sciscionella sp.]